MRLARCAVFSCLAVLPAAATPPCSAQEPVRGGGSIRYPLLGNFREAEGTIEIWFTPVAAREEMFPELGPGQTRSAFRLFSLQSPESFSASCGWLSKRSGRVVNGKPEPAQHQVYVSANSFVDRDGMHSVAGSAAEWLPGEPHHVAFTWLGRDMRMVLDGRESGSRLQGIPFSGIAAGQSLVIGDPEGRRSAIIVHAVRTSNIARTAAGLANAQPVADLYTLLLDRFGAADSIRPRDKRTRPEVISSPEADAGLLQGDWHHVGLPRAGLALFRPSAERP